jgi:hypothetical protein
LRRRVVGLPAAVGCGAAAPRPPARRGRTPSRGGVDDRPLIRVRDNAPSVGCARHGSSARATRLGVALPDSARGGVAHPARFVHQGPHRQRACVVSPYWRRPPCAPTPRPAQRHRARGSASIKRLRSPRGSPLVSIRLDSFRERGARSIPPGVDRSKPRRDRDRDRTGASTVPHSTTQHGSPARVRSHSTYPRGVTLACQPGVAQ